jgi:alanine dehydrogenase
LIAKVAPLTEAESEMLQTEQILFCFLHLETGKRQVLENLLKKNITAIGYELIERDGILPVLHSMSEIAGQLSIQMAERYLESTIADSRGILLGGISGVSPAAVVILGAGVVGTMAARAAVERGAQVIVLDREISRLRRIDQSFPQKITTVIANPYTISRGVKYADVLIGAVLSKGGRVPLVVSEEMVKTMKRGSVIIDVSIDQGGCIATSHPTSLSSPVYSKYNVIHYCVPNMPSLVARTATYGLTNASLEYILNIADNGLTNELLGDSGLSGGVCTFNGFCSNEAIAEVFNIEYKRLRIFSNN